MASKTVHSLVYKMTADARGFTKGVVASKSELRDAKKTFEATRTPIERYRSRMDELGNLLKKGAIDQQTYNRAVSQLVNPSRRASLVQGFFNTNLGKMLKVAGPAALAIGAINLATRTLTRSISSVIEKLKEQFGLLDSLAKGSDKLGIDPLKMRQLSRVVGFTSEATEEGFNNALQRMIRNAAEASAGSKQLQQTFRDLGVSARDLATLSPDQLFLQVADGIRATANQSERIRLTFKVFGREGTSLVNTLQMGGREIDNMARGTVKFGDEFTRNALLNVEEANDAMGRLRNIFDDVWAVAAIKFAPVALAIVDTFEDLIGNGEGFKSVIDDIVVATKAVLPFLADMIAFVGGGFAQIAGSATVIMSAFTALTGDLKGAKEQLNSGLNIINRGTQARLDALQMKFSTRLQDSFNSQDSAVAKDLPIKSVRFAELTVKEQKETNRVLKDLRDSTGRNRIQVRSAF